MKIIANEIGVEVEDSGGNGHAVLLIMGLGMQLTAWPAPFMQALVDAGYRVLRHDNRDVGLSQYFDQAPTGNLLWEALRHKFGLAIRAPYSLQDMALDALGLLDALDIDQAHLIGVSMGGMVAQRMAATAPARVRTLTSVMSSSGAAGLPGARSDVAAALMRRPKATSETALVDHALGFARLIASPGWPFDEVAARERITMALRRAYHPAGVVRHMLAVGADNGRRPELLARIACPALVLHGDADPLIPIACGQDTARCIDSARFVAVPGMGHDLPDGVLPLLLSHILPLLANATES